MSGTVSVAREITESGGEKVVMSARLARGHRIGASSLDAVRITLTYETSGDGAVALDRYHCDLLGRVASDADEDVLATASGTFRFRDSHTSSAMMKMLGGQTEHGEVPLPFFFPLSHSAYTAVHGSLSPSMFTMALSLFENMISTALESEGAVRSESGRLVGPAADPVALMEYAADGGTFTRTYSV